MNQSQALLLTLACEVPILLALASLCRTEHPPADTPRPPAPPRHRWLARHSFVAGIRIPDAICTSPRHSKWARLSAPVAVLLSGIAASCLTHPLAWHAASVLAADEYRRGLWLIEALVVLAEALVYSLLLRPGWRNALLWSALANGASFALGQLPLWG